jgi:hypothetical protein
MKDVLNLLDLDDPLMGYAGKLLLLWLDEFVLSHGAWASTWLAKTLV